MALKILGICGSLREGSYNRKLLKIAEGIVKNAGEEYAEFDIKESGIPVYNGDIEDKGTPESVASLKTAVESSDVVLFALPEYNHSIPGGLKNAIDWASRCGGNSWGGKVAAIFGASTGPFGTVRSQLAIRQSFLTLNILALPSPQVFVPNASAAFNDDGSLKEKKTFDSLKKLIEATLAEAKKRKA